MKHCILPVIAGVCLSFFSAVGSAKAVPLPPARGDEEAPAKDSPRVARLFEAMHKGTCADHTFPELTWDDIPALLKRADSGTILRTFPVNGLSSQRQAECSEGVMALWLIEGIRQGGKFPSLNPICLRYQKRGSDFAPPNGTEQEKFAKAYRAWWKKVKDMGKDKGRSVNPLAGTPLGWY